MWGKSRGAIAAAVVLAVAAVAYVLISGAANSHSATTTPNNAPSFAPRAAAISREMLSGNAVAVRDAIAMPAGVQLNPAAVESLANLKGLAFKPATFHEQSPWAAVVRAVVTDSSGTRRNWTLDLIRVAGEWKVAQSTSGPS